MQTNFSIHPLPSTACLQLKRVLGFMCLSSDLLVLLCVLVSNSITTEQRGNKYTEYTGNF